MNHHTQAMTRGRLRVLVVAVAGLLAAALVAVAPVQAKPAQKCDNQNNNTLQKLLTCMTVDGVREHQAALQAIADNSDDPDYPDSRAAGTEGYADSVDYVVNTLETAGWDVSLDPVEITYTPPSLLTTAHPGRGRLPDRCLHGSGSGTSPARSSRSTSTSKVTARAPAVVRQPTSIPR